ncbi:hypothetical protein [Micromonospora robiginosa]|uniref:Uncharacterized protein n=1 Tax=Micromonospora robiginosa TaxID=2749844 RepID=A0AAF0P5V3_9ACTN|nr:hypothetical protein [Micromonospora ferruginea]WMF04476.1 hypothetical protein H1D33_30075 [Micromonospora ferruginea]
MGYVSGPAGLTGRAPRGAAGLTGYAPRGLAGLIGYVSGAGLTG